MEQKIVQCLESAILIGFEPAKKTRDCRIIQGIIFQLNQRVQVQHIELWQNNLQLYFTQNTQSKLNMGWRYLILFTIDVSITMAGSRQNNFTKSVREILDTLDNDDMICGLVFNDECHMLNQYINLEQRNILKKRKTEAR